MEKVFERYVERTLRRSLPHSARLRTQAAGQSLCRHDGRSVFQLRPDFLIEYQGSTWVVDAKWKLLDASDAANHYGLSQADFYQMFAYAHRYRSGAGELALVYPACETFDAPLRPFDYGAGHILHVLPLDLDSGHLPSPLCQTA